MFNWINRWSFKLQLFKTLSKISRTRSLKVINEWSSLRSLNKWFYWRHIQTFDRFFKRQRNFEMRNDRQLSKPQPKVFIKLIRKHVELVSNKLGIKISFINNTCYLLFQSITHNRLLFVQIIRDLLIRKFIDLWFRSLKLRIHHSSNFRRCWSIHVNFISPLKN